MGRISRLAAEALILHDAAEELLSSLEDRPDLADVARPAGSLKARFVELRLERDTDVSFGESALQRFTAASSECGSSRDEARRTPGTNLV